MSDYELNYEVFASGKALIEANWGRELPDPMVEHWYEELRVYTNNEFMNAVKLLLREEEGNYMPPIARLLDRCKEQRRAHLKEVRAQLESEEAKRDRAFDEEFGELSAEEKHQIVIENLRRIKEMTKGMFQNGEIAPKPKQPRNIAEEVAKLNQMIKNPDLRDIAIRTVQSKDDLLPVFGDDGAIVGVRCVSVMEQNRDAN